ncbi:cytochrome c oxidase assembly protein [Nocardioides limicola]|uniref:cytochrome c oxidase assembly protein n=1 Tax=Nocardioides limicola TaxID=2803368 RepID=UPI00193B7EE7|nr:cytochrome c oxidase assembly protein [Nocardioides sp. DJM-14]
MPLATESAALDLPEFTFGRVFSTWTLDPALFVVAVWATGAYLYAVYLLRRRGDRWPVGRTIAFVGGGMGTFFFATHSGLGVYDSTLLSVHMVQHMVLSMIVPLFLALGAPVTLALRTLPPAPRSWLLALLHSGLAKVLGFPPLAFGLFVLTPWALYFSPWYDASVSSEYVHAMTHIHMVAVGALFFWPLMGVDPLPGRVEFPFRMLLVFLTLPFHAFLGLTVMNQVTLIGEDHYLGLREGPMGEWLPEALADQHLAGGILWGSGDLVAIVFLAVLFSQWVRQSLREGEREDRRLDRLEAQQRRAEADNGGPDGGAAPGGVR